MTFSLFFSQANVSRVITVSPAVQPVVERSVAIDNVVPAQGVPEKNDVAMDNSETFPSIGHNLSPINNEVKRAKYDETVDMETPSTSCQDAISKTESTQMEVEVEEEPEIIEVS